MTIETGFIDLDRAIGSINDGELIILGGRPSLGKTSLAFDIAINCNKEALFFSLEAIHPIYLERLRLSKKEVWLSEYDPTSIGSTRLTKPYGDMREIRKRFFSANDSKNVNIDFFIIDYIQLIDTKEPLHELKTLAQEINKPILALSQLSRRPDLRQDNHPRVSDLDIIDKKQIDYADKVLLIYRDFFYFPEVHPNIAEITVHSQNPEIPRSKAFLQCEFVHVTGDTRAAGLYYHTILPKHNCILAYGEEK